MLWNGKVVELEKEFMLLEQARTSSFSQKVQQVTIHNEIVCPLHIT